MGKAYSKAAKRRAKKAAMPELAETPRKQPNGRKRRKAGDVADSNADKVVLEARARKTGGKVRDMRDQRFGSQAGMAINHLATADMVNDLLNTYSGFSASYERYMRTVIGISPHAKTAKIEMMPERFEARDDDRPDDRTEEERALSAALSWEGWKRKIQKIGRGHASALFSAVYGYTELMADQKPTPAGISFVSAVMALDDY